MNKEKIGKFLCELRKEKKMTQEDVAKILYTSRENISKWERGIHMPTPDTLLELSKLYNISVNEILSGEKKTKENQDTVDNISVELLKESNAKIKKLTKYFVTVIIVIVFAFFVYYFLNTYNTIHVFLVSGTSEKFSTIDGIAIFSKNKSYIKLGKLKKEDDVTIESIEFLYNDESGNIHTIITSDELDYVLTSVNNHNQFFSYRNINYMKNNSFLKIKYNNMEEVIKLEFKEDMSNDFLFQNDESDDLEINKNSLFKDDSIIIIEKYFKDNFNYNKESRQYYKKLNENNNSINMYYSIDTFNISIFEDSDDGLSKSYIYNIISNEFEYQSEIFGKIKTNFVYNTKNKQCISEDCDENIVEYFQNKYLKKII